MLSDNNSFIFRNQYIKKKFKKKGHRKDLFEK